MRANQVRNVPMSQIAPVSVSNKHSNKCVCVPLEILKQSHIHTINEIIRRTTPQLSNVGSNLFGLMPVYFTISHFPMVKVVAA